MKDKIKQAAAIALVFLLSGGCAGAEKNIGFEPQSTVSSTAVSEKAVMTELIDEETTALQSEETTGNVTATHKTVASTGVTETKASTTAVPSTKTTAKTEPTTQKAVTTKKNTTVKVTDTTAVTAQPTTKAPSSTANNQNKEGIIIGLKSIRFGCDMQSVTGAFGSPSETVTETLETGGTVTSLVYAENYGELAVFQFLNGRLFAFYTVDKNTIITDGESSYSLQAGGETEFSEVRISVYKDSKRGGREYALKASFGGFNYYPHELTSLAGQERLIFHTTNALRAVNGLYALEYSGKASDCVRAHCEDMSQRNYFSHDTPEGVTSSQRMRNSGIEYTSCGENLAAGYLDAFGFVDGWYNSSGHRKNLLDSGYRYLGVCVVSGNESYNLYAGQSYYA
ncbi:MAG: hypothetical protein IJD49_00940 [Clostridia bacterium]|nr:hypothetical protein [Clostridia bacterium]